MKGLIIVVAVQVMARIGITRGWVRILAPPFQYPVPVQVSLCLKTMLKIRPLPLCCYPFIKQPIKIQAAICLPFVIVWMLLHSLREWLTLPPLFHKASSSPRGGEFRGIFVAIIVASSPGLAE